VKRTVQLKNIYEYQKRISALAEAFAIDKSKTAGNRILVFDDLSPDGASVPKDARAATSLPGQRKNAQIPKKSWRYLNLARHGNFALVSVL